MPDAVFFGSIGTLVETTDMQRRAFNKAFEAAGLDWHWTQDMYLPMLQQSGGRHRIERFAESRGETVDAEMLHAAKVEAFADLMATEGVDLRPGVRDLVDAAKERGMMVAFVTSTGREQINGIFDALDGALLPSEFDYIGNSGLVARGKPAPDIFLDALQTLDLSANQVIAIEDTPICAEASVAARIETIGFPNSGVGDQPFPYGVEVVETLLADLLYEDGQGKLRTA